MTTMPDGRAPARAGRARTGALELVAHRLEARLRRLAEAAHEQHVVDRARERERIGDLAARRGVEYDVVRERGRALDDRREVVGDGVERGDVGLAGGREQLQLLA